MDDKQIFDCWETYKELLKKTNRPGIDAVIKWLDESDFKFAPASTKYHNSFKGGLLKHSLDVYYHMYDFKNLLAFFDLQEDTIILTSLLHDVCKVDCYNIDYRNSKNEEGQWIKVPYYTWGESKPYGHGHKSIILLLQLGLQLNDIEIAMIMNHMGFSNTVSDKESNRVSALFSACPQCLVLHYADELATYTTESTDLQTRFKQKLGGRNITECLQIQHQKQTIVVDGFEYKLAPQDSEVDGQKIITVPQVNQLGVKVDVKVYAPHGDGLPF